MNVNVSLENAYFLSYNKLEFAKKSNLYVSIFLIVAGLIGHSLTILVFSQSRFRRNSANVFLLLLAVSLFNYFIRIFYPKLKLKVNDAGFLLSHFFEDTLKTFRLFYSVHNTFFDALNIVDRFEIACRLVNYLR